MNTPVLQLLNVEKSYGRVHALRGVDLVVPAGQIVGLVGHNGAGKSTTLKIVTGLLRPSAGQVLLEGVDAFAEPAAARLKFGAVLEEPAVFPYLSAREHLELVVALRGGGDVDAALELAGLGDDADRFLREYSQGMRRRAMLAMAMVGSPPLIVLDEAFNGLDVESAARVTRALREHASSGGSVLVSTHSEVTLRAVDRIVRLSGGRVDLDVPVEGGVVPPDVMPD